MHYHPTTITPMDSKLYNARSIVAFGAQVGDEGKGKFVDLLSSMGRSPSKKGSSYDITTHVKYSVRANGGHNAGHVIKIMKGDELISFDVHLLPSTIFHDDIISVMGAGMAIYMPQLVKELERARNELGIERTPEQLKISSRAHIIMPWHITEDCINEASRTGKNKIGTTKSGIGPAYADKCARSRAMRMGDLCMPVADIQEKIFRVCRYKNVVLGALAAEHKIEFEPFDPQQVFDKFMELRSYVMPYVFEGAEAMLREASNRGDSILVELANGFFLDIDWSTSPYCTSSHTTTLGIPQSTGLLPNSLDVILGVSKVYSVRVGAGPLVGESEIESETADAIRVVGNEFGTTTGRPRRCTWLDLVALKHSLTTSGANICALTMLDVLSQFKEIKICTAYELPDGTILDHVPFSAQQQFDAKPIYTTMPGPGEVADVRQYDLLPQSAKDIVEFIEEFTGVPVHFVSVGPEREAFMTKPLPLDFLAN
ncbi:hypothetical protein PCE1_004303 [Barthelona sp. PCE]